MREPEPDAGPVRDAGRPADRRHEAAARRTTLAAIRSDEADLVVGTHAILSEGVEFARLGLAVVDEQHASACASAECWPKRPRTPICW
mgnify:CR=1 FL=1